MTVERVGFPDPVSKPKKTERPARTEKTSAGADAINVSSGAKEKAEIYNATEVAKAAPDLRLDRIEEVKRKLDDPMYITDKVIGELADRLLEVFKISS
jgi:negative regulator of flagellin synthesis FlgM